VARIPATTLGLGGGLTRLVGAVRRAQISATMAILGAVIALGASPASAAISARGTLSGSGTSYSLEVSNTGDITLERMTFTAAGGVTITGSGGPGVPTGSSSTGFSRGRISIEPGTAGVFTFTTSAAYPVNGGGALGVATNSGRFVTASVSGPEPPPSPPSGSQGFQPPLLFPPVLSANDDGDSVPNAGDLCPTTPAGFRAIEQGCSLVDFIVSPNLLLEGAKGTVGAALLQLRGPHGLRRKTRPSQRLLTRGLSGLNGAAQGLALNPCLSSRKAKTAMQLATKGAGGIANLLTLAKGTVTNDASRFYRKRPKAGGDSDAFSVRFYGLAWERDNTREALGVLRRVQRLIGAACGASKGARKVTGRVVSLDSDSAVARLDNGTTLVLGGARQVAGVGPGAKVEARGIGLKGNVVVAGSAKGQGIKLNPDQIPCGFKIKIAPVQDFAQSNADILYYDSRGYTSFGLYLLEGGMGIGADRGTTCNKKDDYFMGVFLDYRNTSKQNVTKLIGLLGGKTGEAPAKIPKDVDPKKPATLRFEVYGIGCQTSPQCIGGTIESKSQALTIIRKQGTWGKAVFDRNVFGVEDGSKTGFSTGTLVGGDAPLLPNSIVFGVGYGISNGKSTRPTRQYIVPGDQFAVHDDVPSAKNPGGLFWAYVNGLRNGFPYYYVARLPRIVTDRVTVCPGGSEDSFYRLPWKAGTAQEVTQGNNTQFTHKGGQKFAFDFKMPDGTSGVAPRGGVVDFLVESRNKTSIPNKDPWVPGNVLRIKHQDGTFSWYEHMRKNGVVPKKGDLVERGDKVVVTDNTGNSTGAHLHYHVTTAQGADDAAGNNSSRGGTIQIRFELIIGFQGAFGPINTGVTATCAIPPKGVYFSTNGKPTS
jgi:murein DD-endopeptidase MepM/ murein hydrolase activator NlpD